jgi:hypothetical protein
VRDPTHKRANDAVRRVLPRSEPEHVCTEGFDRVSHFERQKQLIIRVVGYSLRPVAGPTPEWNQDPSTSKRIAHASAGPRVQATSSVARKKRGTRLHSHAVAQNSHFLRSFRYPDNLRSRRRMRARHVVKMFVRGLCTVGETRCRSSSRPWLRRAQQDTRQSTRPRQQPRAGEGRERRR